MRVSVMALGPAAFVAGLVGCGILWGKSPYDRSACVSAGKGRFECDCQTLEKNQVCRVVSYDDVSDETERWGEGEVFPPFTEVRVTMWSTYPAPSLPFSVQRATPTGWEDIRIRRKQSGEASLNLRGSPLGEAFQPDTVLDEPTHRSSGMEPRRVELIHVGASGARVRVRAPRARVDLEITHTVDWCYLAVMASGSQDRMHVAPDYAPFGLFAPFTDIDTSEVAVAPACVADRSACLAQAEAFAVPGFGCRPTIGSSHVERWVYVTANRREVTTSWEACTKKATDYQAAQNGESAAVWCEPDLHSY